MAATASTVTARTSETAFANEVEGECPVCHKPMKVSETNGIDVYVCMTHRVVMPIKNEA
jgi:ssDNA-binding Zn-finger/Zn-ribbon topoisomerase 1